METNNNSTQHPKYHISPVTAVLVVVLNIAAIKSGSFHSSWPAEEYSVGHYIVLYIGMALTLYVAIHVIIDFSRNAGDNPWYMKYILLYLGFISIGYIGLMF